MSVSPAAAQRDDHAESWHALTRVVEANSDYEPYRKLLEVVDALDPGRFRAEVVEPPNPHAHDSRQFPIVRVTLYLG